MEFRRGLFRSAARTARLSRPNSQRRKTHLDPPMTTETKPTGGSLLGENPGSLLSSNQQPAGRLGLSGVAMEKLNIVGPLLSSIIQMLILVGAVAILFAALSGALGLSGSPALVAKPLIKRRQEAMPGWLEGLFPMYSRSTEGRVGKGWVRV